MTRWLPVLGAVVLSTVGVHANVTAQAASHSPTPTAPGQGYFYRGLGFGSDAYMGPLTVLLNKGLALSITETASFKLFTRYGVRSVGDALVHPVLAIERGGGWSRFLRTEMLPLTSNPAEMKWFTNYMGHLFEGGAYYRYLAEWYRAHGVPAPALLAGLTNLSAALLNELYESRNEFSGSSGTVADLYFFDFASVALFSIEPVPRFFATKLHAGLWPGQASLVFPRVEIENNATRLFFKVPWGVIPNSSVFFWSGIGAQLGLTLHRPNGLDLSFGAGLDTETRRVDPVTGEESVTFDAAGAVFLDRQGSLLASLQFTQVDYRSLTINVYPGVFPGFARNLGAWAIVGRDGRMSLGLSHQWLGVGAGFRP